MLFILKGNFGSKIASYLLFYNLPLRHSLLDAVAVRLHPLEKLSTNGVVIIVHILTSSDTSTGFMMRNTLLTLDDFLLSSTTPLTSVYRDLVHVMDETCPPACIVFYLEVLLSFMSSML
jgi:hypothetical protein